MLIVWLLLGDLQTVENAYSEAEFEQVSALVPLQNVGAAQKKRLYELGAFAEFFLGHEQQSARYFELMFAADSRASVDERKYPPKAVAFYRLQRDKRRVTSPTTTVTTAPPSTRFRPISLIPFGIGHLLLGDIPAGVAFMVVPAALIVTSVALYSARQSERLPGDRYANAGRANAMQITQNVAAFAAIAVSIYGVIDAALFAQDRVAARKAKIAVAPYGAGLQLAIQY